MSEGYSASGIVLSQKLSIASMHFPGLLGLTSKPAKEKESEKCLMNKYFTEVVVGKN